MNVSKTIRILIADDHPIVRDALKNLVTNNNMIVVGEVENGIELLESLNMLKCDLLMLDMSMPGEPVGPELIREIIARSDNSPPILVFSMSNDRGTAAAALRAGASGYITKDSEPNLILEAIHKVVENGKFVCPTIAEQILFGNESDLDDASPQKMLSPREYQIFLMLIAGKSMEEIAAELCISRQTVGTHKMRLMRKLNLQNNIDIVRYAINHGLISS